MEKEGQPTTNNQRRAQSFRMELGSMSWAPKKLLLWPQDAVGRISAWVKTGWGGGIFHFVLRLLSDHVTSRDWATKTLTSLGCIVSMSVFNYNYESKS